MVNWKVQRDPNAGATAGFDGFDHLGASTRSMRWAPLQSQDVRTSKQRWKGVTVS
jgi:hypothetical protein